MWAFVDGRSNSYDTDMRSLVMTNVYDAKRKRSKRLDRASKTWPLEVLFVTQTAGSPILSSSSNSEAKIGFLSAEKPQNDKRSKDIWAHPSLQPRTILGAGQIDHFSTLPIPRTKAIDEFLVVCSYFHRLHFQYLISGCRSRPCD